MSRSPISVDFLTNYVTQQKLSDGFASEFESIKTDQQFTTVNCDAEHNKTKNRYPQITAYDHSRVILQAIDGVEGSDYINANFQDGYKKQNAYIASQGPLPQTFADFWRMIWENNSTAIVMITQIEEAGRVKCGQYWPNSGTETYGQFQVTHVSSEDRPSHTLRTFQLSRNESDEKRVVNHFQFTAWPEHGVPEDPSAVLALREHVRSLTSDNAGPPVVHCSAGVGRTGAYIAIDSMLERLKEEGNADVPGFVTQLRSQRNLMVQTLDQYVFVYDSLSKAFAKDNH